MNHSSGVPKERANYASRRVRLMKEQSLQFHLKEVLEGRRRFENVFQAVYRMILEDPIEKVVRAGRTVYDFKFFRKGKRPVIGWYDELNALVTFIKEAAEKRSSRERAFVFVGPPGNGKTFVIDYLSNEYRNFTLKRVNGERPNMRYTFELVNLGKIKGYGEELDRIQSQTFEDPMILAMNLFSAREESIEFLQERFGFSDQQIEALLDNYRPLGADTEYIWRDIWAYCDGDVDKALEFVKIVPQPISEALGTLTTKYSAEDKLTASSAKLVGEEDPTIRLHVADRKHPYRIDVSIGALARAGGGGIHFADELFKNKIDLINTYLQIIQPRGGEVRHIENSGFKWPIDTLILATSNDEEYQRFINEQGQGPIKDRCTVHFVGYNTDYKLQQELIRQQLRGRRISTIRGEEMHIDPNLEKTFAIAITLTRLPRHPKLEPIEMLKLEAGEEAGDKDVKTLLEVKDELNASVDVRKRWGQTGLSEREVGKIFELLASMPESNEKACIYALDVFKAMDRVIKDNVINAIDRDKFLSDIPEARKLHRKEVKASIYNAFRDDPSALSEDVMLYVNMIVGIGSPKLGPDKIWTYRDRLTGEMRPVKIDEKFINAVEERMGLKTNEAKESFRQNIRKVYAERIPSEPAYDFTEDERLVKAVTEVRTESDVGAAGSLIGALANRTNKENLAVYNRMLKTMVEKLNYCGKRCAEETIEYWCTKVDE